MTSSSFDLHPHFLILPREGCPFENGYGEKFEFKKLAPKINNLSTQKSALESIGIRFVNGELVIEFYEIGRPYQDITGDRSLVEPENVKESFTVKLSINETKATPNIPLTIHLVPFLQDGLNFLGRIEFNVKSGLLRTIPLVGFGTVALDGRSGDYHAGFSIDAEFASFQQRAALVMAVAVATGVEKENRELLQKKLEQVNSKFHGRDNLLHYTFLCANEENVETYLEFLKRLYDACGSIIPPPLHNYIVGTGPLEQYYNSLAKYFPAEDLIKEQETWAEKASYRAEHQNQIYQTRPSEKRRRLGIEKFLIVCVIILLTIFSMLFWFYIS